MAENDLTYLLSNVSFIKEFLVKPTISFLETADKKHLYSKKITTS